MGSSDLNECREKVNRLQVEGSMPALSVCNFSLLVMSSVDIFIKHLEGLLSLLEVLLTFSFVKIRFPSITKLWVLQNFWEFVEASDWAHHWIEFINQVECQNICGALSSL